MSCFYFSEVKALEGQAELKKLKDSNSKKDNGKIKYFTDMIVNVTPISEK